MKLRKLWTGIATAALTTVLGTTGSLFCSVNKTVASPAKIDPTSLQQLPDKPTNIPKSQLSTPQPAEIFNLDSDRIQTATESKDNPTATIHSHQLQGVRKNNSALRVTAVAADKPQSKPSPSQKVKGGKKSGIASYYGPGFHGRRTASGERFNQHGLTAAHRSLPFGTKVRVTNVRNGRSVVVRINDRGPHTKGRVIDLSSGAASAIGLGGTAPVRLEVLGI